MNLPLIRHSQADAALFYDQGRMVPAARFLSEAAALAERLPEAEWAMNLCDNRYQFAVGLGAALLRGQCTLMPPNRAPEAIRELLRDYPNSHIVWDRGLPGLEQPPVPAVLTDGAISKQEIGMPEIPANQPAVMAFTSGSTGKPKPNPKTWSSLNLGTEMACRRFFADGRPRHIVATVPAQHMYGLETSILYALLGGCPTHADRPFFAADINEALRALPAPRVLVTTPAHLRALLQSGIEIPEVEFMISATAPLPLSLAQHAEQRFDTAVREIYGCTEAGSLASRRQTQSPEWLLYDGMTLTDETAEAQPRFILRGPQLAEPVPLQDQIEVGEDGLFRLLGRNEDMLNIAGKRASLGELTSRLLELEGVEDAVMLAPEDTEDARVGRIAALVVAPSRDAEALLAELRDVIDPAFLPRPLLRVDSLPRTESSKLPRAAVMDLFRERLREQT